MQAKYSIVQYVAKYSSKVHGAHLKHAACVNEHAAFGCIALHAGLQHPTHMPLLPATATQHCTPSGTPSSPSLQCTSSSPIPQLSLRLLRTLAAMRFVTGILDSTAEAPVSMHNIQRLMGNMPWGISPMYPAPSSMQTWSILIHQL